MFRRVLFTVLTLTLVAAIPDGSFANQKKQAAKQLKKDVKKQNQVIKKNRPVIKKTTTSIKKNTKDQKAAAGVLKKKDAAVTKAEGKATAASDKVKGLQAKYDTALKQLSATKKNSDKLKIKPGSRAEKKVNKRLVALSKEIGGAKEKVRQLDAKTNRKLADRVKADDALKQARAQGTQLANQKSRLLKQNQDARDEIQRLRAANKAAKAGGGAIADPNPAGAQLLRDPSQPVRRDMYGPAPVAANRANPTYDAPPITGGTYDRVPPLPGDGQYAPGPLAPAGQNRGNEQYDSPDLAL